jgi:AsmA protein
MPERNKQTKRRARIRWFPYGIAALLIVSLVVVVVAFVDERVIRSRFQSAASEALGLDVTIEGATGIGFRPTPHVRAGGVMITRGDQKIAEVEELRVHITAAPLLIGQFHVRHLSLSGASFHVTRDASGRFNFQTRDAEEGGGARALSASLENGSLHYLDESSGVPIEASGCSGKSSRLGLAGGEQAQGIARLELEGELRCETIRRAEYDFSNFVVDIDARKGKIRLDPITFDLFGGAGRGSSEVDFTAEPTQAVVEVVLDDLELQAFLRARAPDAEAEGTLRFMAELSMAGHGWQAMERDIDGVVSLQGKTLRIHGVDLDKRLSDYRSTQEFGLLDAGGVLLAGPIGLVFTKGHDFTRLIRSGGGSTEFPVVVSSWTLKDGVAHAEDVAASTKKNRLAARGEVDYAARRFAGLKIAMLDKRGCAVFEQAVTGSFDDPQVTEPNPVATVLGPLIELVEKGIDQLTGEECNVIYEGSVQPP